VLPGLLAGWADFDDDLTVMGELLAEAFAVAEVAADDNEFAVGVIHVAS
jgi:hypothetical protein